MLGLSLDEFFDYSAYIELLHKKEEALAGVGKAKRKLGL